MTAWAEPMGTKWRVRSRVRGRVRAVEGVLGEPDDWCGRLDEVERFVDWRRHAPCAVGDTLWVREAWRADRLFDDRPPRDVPEWSPTLMLADETHRGGHLGHPGRYRHARFMPRHFSRIDLRVTDVRVERLGDISEADARAEGLRLHAAGWTDGVNGYDTLSARDAFAELWEHVHGDGAWERDRSRWVWVYGFEVVR